MLKIPATNLRFEFLKSFMLDSTLSNVTVEAWHKEPVTQIHGLNITLHLLQLIWCFHEQSLNQYWNSVYPQVIKTKKRERMDQEATR